MSQTENNLADLITAEVQRQTSGDAIKALVEKQIEQIIKRSVEDAFRSYSDLGRKIEKAVAGALDIGEKIDIPSYQNMVMAVLRSKIDENLSGLLNERLATQVEELLNIAPKHLKLSALVEMMKEEVIEDEGEAESYGREIRCDVEASTAVDGYYRIKLDVERKKSRYSTLEPMAAVELGVDSTGRIFSLRIDGKDAATTVAMNAYKRWKKTVFGMFVSGSVLEIDEMHVDVTIGDR